MRCSQQCSAGGKALTVSSVGGIGSKLVCQAIASIFNLKEPYKLIGVM